METNSTLQIDEDFKTSAKRFADQGADASEVQNYISDFKQMKPKIKDASQKDIDKWKQWAEFKAFVDELKTTKTKGQEKKEKKLTGAKLVAEDKYWRVYEITTHDAAMMYGSGTKWCITQADCHYWDQYVAEGDFYFYISKRLPPSSPFYKIAMLVGDDGRKSYWDAKDSEREGKTTLWNRRAGIPFKLPEVPGLPQPEQPAKEQAMTNPVATESVEKGEWKIFDWAGNLKFDGQRFASFDDAEEFLSAKLGDGYEDDRGEFFISQDKTRASNYVDPKDPRSGEKMEAADEVVKEASEADDAKLIEELVAEFGKGKSDEELAELTLEITDSLDWNKGRYSDWGDAGSFKADGTEYNIVRSGDEAEAIALKLVKQDLESEPEIFNQDFIQQHMTITDTDRRLIAVDEADARASDLRYDLERENFEDVFQQTGKYQDEFSALEDKVLNAESGSDEEKAAKAEITKLGEKAIEEWESDYADEVEEALKDPIQYFVKDQGIYSIEDLMKASFISIDVDAAAQDAIDQDGVYHFISLYDGNADTLPSGAVYFRED